MIMKKELRKLDSDLRSCFGYNGGEMSAFKISDIHTVLAAVFGENDGADWHWIVQLCDGRFGYIRGGCDYTGWDCKSDGENAAFDTLEEAINAVPEKEEYYNRGNLRNHIRAQINGDMPFGVIKINSND